MGEADRELIKEIGNLSARMAALTEGLSSAKEVFSEKLKSTAELLTVRIGHVDLTMAGLRQSIEGSLEKMAADDKEEKKIIHDEIQSMKDRIRPLEEYKVKLIAYASTATLLISVGYNLVKDWWVK